MAEWSIAPVLKTGVGASLPGVRLPLSPPLLKINNKNERLEDSSGSAGHILANAHFTARSGTTFFGSSSAVNEIIFAT